MKPKTKCWIAGVICCYVAISWIMFVQMQADFAALPGETLPQVIARMDFSWIAAGWVFLTVGLAGFGLIMAGTFPGEMD